MRPIPHSAVALAVLASALLFILQALLGTGPASAPAFQLVQFAVGVWLAFAAFRSPWQPHAMLAAVAVQAGVVWSALRLEAVPEYLLLAALVHLGLLAALWVLLVLEARREARWNGVLPLRPEAW